jgi:hypothetical protein
MLRSTSPKPSDGNKVTILTITNHGWRFSFRFARIFGQIPLLELSFSLKFINLTTIILASDADLPCNTYFSTIAMCLETVYPSGA